MSGFVDLWFVPPPPCGVFDLVPKCGLDDVTLLVAMREIFSFWIIEFCKANLLKSQDVKSVLFETFQVVTIS